MLIRSELFAPNHNEMDVTKPPPPLIDDSFPHPTLLEQLRIFDEQIVHQFLSKFIVENVPAKSKCSSDALDISFHRHNLHEALQILENLKHSKHIMDELLKANDEHDTKWQNELERTEHLKAKLLSLLEPFEDEQIMKKLSLKLAVRRKKRAWQKRRNERLKNQRKTDEAARQQRLREISSWEDEWKEKLKQERIARTELQTKTAVLNDVRRRKARAKRFLTRFEKSLFLYRQRHFADATPTTEPQTLERFEKKMHSLIAEWRGKLNECVREEKNLKDELNRQSAVNEGRRRENRWRKALFGTAAATGGQRIGNRSQEDCWHELVTVRSAWDQFSVAPVVASKGNNSASGTSSVAPATWIMPPDQPQPEWAMYREPKKIKTRKPIDTTSNYDATF
uniref:Programmed cell death protein 7 n=1 Tax=Anopheles farauti TaxID=69004 RepID=A0A182QTV8_9DIPT